MDTLHQVKLNLSPAQIKKLLKKQVVQIKPNQLNDGITFVSLDKKHYARYRRAKNQKKGMRLQMSDHMINGSGFSDVFKNIKAGAQKVASVAIPYLKDKVKSLLPGVRSDINAVVNPGIDSVASRIKSTLNPLIGDAANELIDQGATSLKGYTKDKLDAIQSSLNGMGLKKGHHYKLTKGGRLSVDFKKIGDFLKPVAQVAVPALVSTVGGPVAGVAASLATDALLGGSVPVAPSKRLLAAPKKKAGRPKKKINGSALMPMGSGRGGALFPM